MDNPNITPKHSVHDTVMLTATEGERLKDELKATRQRCENLEDVIIRLCQRPGPSHIFPGPSGYYQGENRLLKWLTEEQRDRNLLCKMTGVSVVVIIVMFAFV